MAEFKGILPAIITPMAADGQLDEAAFRQVMEFNIQAGVDGFWVAGGTGESVHLDDAENQRIAEIAADQSQGRISNIMHVGAPSTRRAARLAEHAARAGVEAICCVPPFFYPPTDDEVIEHYRIVAAAADLPFFVYNLPQCTGIEVTPELMRKIQDKVPQLTGLKHSAPFFGHTREYVKMGLACLIGNSTLMLPALTVGAAGCVDGPPNVAPEHWVAIWQAYPCWRSCDSRTSPRASHRGDAVSARVWVSCRRQIPHRRASGDRLWRPATTTSSLKCRPAPAAQTTCRSPELR